MRFVRVGGTHDMISALEMESWKQLPNPRMCHGIHKQRRYEMVPARHYFRVDSHGPNGGSATGYGNVLPQHCDFALTASLTNNDGAGSGDMGKSDNVQQR